MTGTIIFLIILLPFLILMGIIYALVMFVRWSKNNSKKIDDMSDLLKNLNEQQK